MDKLSRATMSVHTMISQYRSIERLVTSDKFKRIYKSANDKDLILQYIIKGDKDALLLWMSSNSRKLLGEMSIRELRKIAQRHVIRGYSYMDKATLLSEIVSVENQKDD